MQGWLFVVGVSLLVWSLHVSGYQHPDWSYGSPDGPSTWKDNYKMCAGSHQSPINVETTKVKYNQNLSPFTISLKSALGNYTVKNFGLNAEIFFGDTVWEAKLTGNQDQCYRLYQIHFHWGSDNTKGSEHAIDGKHYPLEAHIVMWNCHLYTNASSATGAVNGLAVLSILFEIGSTAQSNVVMEAIVSALSNKKIRKCPCTPSYEDIATLEISGFDIKQLLPKNMMDFYRYGGSLTTPPCTENVMWTILRHNVHITETQIGVFRSLSNRDNNNGGITKMVNNFRPVNPLNSSPNLSYSRIVTASFQKDSVPTQYVRACRNMFD